MADPAREIELPDRPDVSHLVTEDDEPVDNWFQERQQRLLVESLYASWPEAGQERPFLAAANVGLFSRVANPPVVPDLMVSLDVEPPRDWWEKHNRCYMTWEFGKPPELAVEVVSNPGGSEEKKFEAYARAGVAFYAIYDPMLYLSKRPLRVYALRVGRYVEALDGSRLEGLNLGLVLWEGAFEGMKATWLRCCDKDGRLLLTGGERAQQERERAEQERERAQQERERAEQERERAEQAQDENERLRRKLRELGVDPDA